MSGEKPSREQEIAARTAKAAVEILNQGGVDFGDASPEEILERLQNASAAVAEAEQTVVESASNDGN